MSDTLTFYTNPMSRGRIVRWMLEEVGQPYETVLLDYGTTMKAADYLTVNPMGKVPAIRHGATVVTEAAAICAYLADAFPKAKLAPPPASRARGDYYRWLFFAAGPVETAIVTTSLGFSVPPDRSAMAGWGSLMAVVDVLDATLAQRTWLAGDAFSAADLYVGAQVGWGLQFGTLPARDSFRAYADRCNTRPAAIRARGIDDALMPKQG